MILSTSARKNLICWGHNQRAIGVPNDLDIKKQQVAPEVAEKMTKRTPLYTPNKAPANNEKNIVPGIMKVCMNIYTAT